jgi:hypothetical protein
MVMASAVSNRVPLGAGLGARPLNPFLKQDLGQTDNSLNYNNIRCRSAATYYVSLQDCSPFTHKMYGNVNIEAAPRYFKKTVDKHKGRG